MTDIAVVLNPVSGKADEDVHRAVLRELEALGAVAPVAVEHEDRFAEDVRSAAEKADIVVVAGGDGTLNRTVDALRVALDSLVLGLVPMGTGNDFSRTLGLGDDPVDVARALAGAQVRAIDVCRARGAGVDRLFVNACMGGFPVEVDEATDDRTKKRLGPLAFWIGGLRALGDLTPAAVTVNGRRLEDCVAAGVGNGRTCGGGMEVWPSARPDDGELDACALAVRNPAQGALLAARVKSGSHEGLDGVITDRATTVTIDADPAIEFNVDGELVGLASPATFDVAGRVRFLVPVGAGARG